MIKGPRIQIRWLYNAPIRFAMMTLNELDKHRCMEKSPTILNYMLYLWSIYESLVAQSLTNRSCISDIQFQCLVNAWIIQSNYIHIARQCLFFVAHFYFKIFADKLPQLSTYCMSFIILIYKNFKAVNPKTKVR